MNHKTASLLLTRFPAKNIGGFSMWSMHRCALHDTAAWWAAYSRENRNWMVVEERGCHNCIPGWFERFNRRESVIVYDHVCRERSAAEVLINDRNNVRMGDPLSYQLVLRR